MKEYKNNLLKLIDNVLLGESPNELNKFIWNVISTYLGCEKSCGSLTYNEHVFWYAIWNIQHVIGEDQQYFQDALQSVRQFLVGEMKLMEEYWGYPPNQAMK